MILKIVFLGKEWKASTFLGDNTEFHKRYTFKRYKAEPYYIPIQINLKNLVHIFSALFRANTYSSVQC